MIDYDHVRARLAVQFLVDDSYATHHIRRIRSMVGKPRATPFSGDEEALNELVAIGRQSPQALDNLIAVAEFKRGDRNDYQREYMAAKRRRDRKVVQLEEVLAGRKLPHDNRVQILHNQYVVWNKERDRLVAQHKDLPWAERNAQLREFWARKESEIDELMVEATKRAANPRPRKRVVNVANAPSTAFGQALRDAIKKP